MTARAILPRGLSRIEAAGYIGVSPGLFDQMVEDGRMPAPRVINSRRVYDVRELDDAFESLPRAGSDQQEGNPLDRVAAI